MIQYKISRQQKSLWRYCIDSGNDISCSVNLPWREQVEGKKERDSLDEKKNPQMGNWP